jgi:hypothetical protein
VDAPVVDGDLYTDIQEGRIVAYLHSDLPLTHTGTVLGVITVSGKQADASILKMGVRNAFDAPLFGAPGKFRARWTRWANGDKTCD